MKVLAVYSIKGGVAHRLILTPDAELRGRTPQLILEGVLEKTPLDLGEVNK